MGGLIMVKIMCIKSESKKLNDNSIRSKVHKRNVFVPIETLRNKAVEKLKTESVKFTTQERLKIIQIAQLNYSPTESWIGCISQIKRDINTCYLKYDCLAMWLNSDEGLAKDEPDMIREIALECGLR